MTRRPRIVPPVYLLAAVIAMICLHVWFPIRQIIPGAWRWLGLAPAVVGLALGAAVTRIFIKRKTTIIPGENSTTLLTDGPFRISRNPIYIGMVLLLAGLAIGLGSLTPWLVVPLFVAAISINIIPLEESMLIEAFGQSYRDYQLRVRRWV